MRRIRIVPATCAALLAVTLTAPLAACNSSSGAKTATTVAGGANVNPNEVAKLPANWPSDLTLCDGYKLAGSAAAQGQNATGTSTAIVCPGSAESVLEFYATSLPANGWKLIAKNVTPQGGTVLVNKDGKAATVLVMKDPKTGQTGVILSERSGS